MVNDAYHSWHEPTFILDILLEGEVDLENLERGDAIITLPSGDRYSALMVTREEVSRVMDRHAKSGEALAGGYFATPDLVVVRRAGVNAMIDVVRDIVHSGGIATLLPRISDEGSLDVPTM
jgi:hypothetical protein